MEKIQNDFETNGYVVIKKAIDNETLKYLAAQIKKLEQNICFQNKVKPTDYAFSDKQAETSFSYYSALITDNLLERFCRKIETVVKKQLFPTYSYLRIYYKNSILKKHTDRESCEYSATICITTGTEPWDIWFETKNQEQKQIFLLPGDLIVYKGMELPHWRNKYEHDEQIQIFLHYVDKNGEHAECKYDKRQNLLSCKNNI